MNVRIRRIFTLGPAAKAVPVKLFVQPVGEAWGAMILDPDAPLPGPGRLRGVSFLGDTPEEAEGFALDYLHGLGRLN